MLRAKIKAFTKVAFKIILSIVLTSLPLWMYLIAVKLTKNRFKQYAGMLGTNPACILCYDDIILVDISNLQI